MSPRRRGATRSSLRRRDPAPARAPPRPFSKIGGASRQAVAFGEARSPFLPTDPRAVFGALKPLRPPKMPQYFICPRGTAFCVAAGGARCRPALAFACKTVPTAERGYAAIAMRAARMFLANATLVRVESLTAQRANSRRVVSRDAGGTVLQGRRRAKPPTECPCGPAPRTACRDAPRSPRRASRHWSMRWIPACAGTTPKSLKPQLGRNFSPLGPPVLGVKPDTAPAPVPPPGPATHAPQGSVSPCRAPLPLANGCAPGRSGSPS
jgi:hypothetical protein